MGPSAAVFRHRRLCMLAQFIMTATATAAVARPRGVNPYAKPAQNSVINDENMGRQSQQRVSNQHKRKCKQASPRRRRKGDQLTLQGAVAFDPEADCQICRAQSIKKFMPSYTVPKRSHHTRCPRNTKTLGLGDLTEQTMATLAENKRHKTITAPIRPDKKFSGKHNTKAAALAFFAAAKTTTTKTTITKPMTEVENFPQDIVSPTSLSKAVGKLVSDPDFQARHRNKMAPLAMLAFATEISKKIINNKDKSVLLQYFDGIEMVVPTCQHHDDPHYHSISGTKLLYVDWEQTYGMQVPCPDQNCSGTLATLRTNFSKNPHIWYRWMSYLVYCGSNAMSLLQKEVLIQRSGCLNQHTGARGKLLSS